MNYGMIYMRLLKYFVGCGLALSLMACGGGGGSAGGATNGGTTGGTGTPVTKSPSITLTIVDASGSVVSTNSIGSGAVFYAKVVVTNAASAAVANKLVSFSTDAAVATLAQSSALTDTNGVAKVQISPTSVTTSSAGSLQVSTTVDAVALSTSLDYQTAAANVSLRNMAVANSTINALQTTAVTVEGLVNSALAGSGAVAVNFSAACGTFSPASASTNSVGIASTTYEAAASCSGPVTLTAQATGATAVTTMVTVNSARATNVVFSSATVPLMVSSAATGGLKQSTLRYQVLDSVSTGMSGQNVNISLGAAAINAGVTFSVGGVASTSNQVVTTDGSGYASVTVSSGSLPTPVVVTAALVSDVTISASSYGVAVTSGRATQNAASLSATKLSIEAYRVDGINTTLTMRIADRQGNPVPSGAIVNFVTGYGLVQGSCSIDAASQCQVTYTSQGTIRGYNNLGRVAILAYMDGEESFLDTNGDNIWQSGETFYDVGFLYRDDNEDGTYSSSSEQSYPGGATGSIACSVYGYPSIVNTCDGTWSSSVRVRKQITIALATSDALIALVPKSRTLAGFTVLVTDKNGNAMPTGTTVGAVIATSGAVCKVVGAVSPNVVRNLPDGGVHDIHLDSAADCGTVIVNVTVTTPGGTATTVGF